ncbi:DNA-formamidopyrimidine glycosylase [Candidatus Uhrbacteria bacterium RIFCSPHIGHO2_02_FULL_60_10]|uniref:Formamidopyrimidine-DNA glycosylase n=1 Tax=Candidatus Uhrbacteria bacterium RIFCSPHIGHO2_02_FULL_60_10 TaxID=1802392 RepID=A0A1F7U518_9BACT|nr:MAG: DNA-formamidopyrimidine glycosylase [Candidatus Uhrbacteria bacterium RIFCSPHIGHO2_02_FULL_60_10]
MPELPEVETIRRQLEKEIVGSRVAAVTVRFGKRLKPSAAAVKRAAAGGKILSVGRRAKLLLINLDTGWTLAAHLKMTGKFLINAPGTEPGKHTHLIFDLADGRRLFFNDVRKFGYLRAVRTERLEKEVFAEAGYGPEPLARDFTAERLAACIRPRPGKPIKPLLMDQTCVAGIGNIYADEACWLAGIRPDRRVKTLTESETRRLHRGIVDCLRRSVRLRGTSADDYADLYGQPGRNQLKLEVYGREGERCRRCGGTVKKIRLGGRAAHYCPGCQV